MDLDENAPVGEYRITAQDKEDRDRTFTGSFQVQRYQLEKMKLALILNIINPGLAGVLIRGEKGTAKSTAVRALADILPQIQVFADDRFQLDPAEEKETYREISQILNLPGLNNGDLPAVLNRKVSVVELPVGATEDRVVGNVISEGLPVLSRQAVSKCELGLAEGIFEILGRSHGRGHAEQSRQGPRHDEDEQLASEHETDLLRG